MLPELRYELLFFFTRNELEHLQPLSRTLLDMIVAGSNVLPLRSIHRVDMSWYAPGGKIRIFIEKPAAGGAPEPDYEASILVGDFEETFRRLQHTCIMEFNVGIRGSPFLRYWKAQETTAFTVVSLDFPLRDDTDYDVLDSIVNHLRPRTTEEVTVEESSWQENGYNQERLKLLTRESFLTNLQTCRLTVWEGAFPAPSFILEEPGYTNYELWCGGCEVVDGIDAFIESFVLDGCANQRLESVCVKWNDDDGPSPKPKKLSKPTKTDTPLPKSEMVMAWIPAVHRVSQCEKHSFVDKKQWKRMEVYKWSVEYDLWSQSRTTHILQCRVENL